MSLLYNKYTNNNRFIRGIVSTQLFAPIVTNNSPAIKDNSRAFTTSSLHVSSAPVLNPNYVTGFADGEGCYLVSVYKDKKHKTKKNRLMRLSCLSNNITY